MLDLKKNTRDLKNQSEPMNLLFIDICKTRTFFESQFSNNFFPVMFGQSFEILENYFKSKAYKTTFAFITALPSECRSVCVKNGKSVMRHIEGKPL